MRGKRTSRLAFSSAACASARRWISPVQTPKAQKSDYHGNGENCERDFQAARHYLVPAEFNGRNPASARAIEFASDPERVRRAHYAFSTDTLDTSTATAGAATWRRTPTAAGLAAAGDPEKFCAN